MTGTNESLRRLQYGLLKDLGIVMPGKPLRYTLRQKQHRLRLVEKNLAGESNGIDWANRLYAERRRLRKLLKRSP